MKRADCVWISLLLLLPGAGIYLFVNRGTYLNRLIPGYIPQLPETGTVLERLLRWYGADFFWAAAFALLVQSVLMLRGRRRAWLLLCAVLGVVVEGMQAVHLLSGTCDGADILAYCAGTVFAIGIIRRGGSTNENSEN